jgi:hypothetical protein
MAKLFPKDIVYSYMKTAHVILALLASTVVLFASFVTPYDKTKPPALPLPDAYQLAVAALGSATNQFHCLSAGIEEFGGGRWLFTFYSTNTPPKTKFVVVEFGGAASVADVYVR